MSLQQYFSTTEGLGILSTADENGQPNAAVFSRPHVIDEQTVAFIMAPRKSKENVSRTNKACFLFKEDSQGYKGKRLYLTKVSEVTDTAQVDEFRRLHSKRNYERYKDLKSSVVTFHVDRVLPLIGDGVRDAEHHG